MGLPVSSFGVRTAGQLLAEIETPEIDQKLNQAVQRAAENLELARATLKAGTTCCKEKSSPRKEFDEKKAGAVANPIGSLREGVVVKVQAQPSKS